MHRCTCIRALEDDISCVPSSAHQKTARNSAVMDTSQVANTITNGPVPLIGQCPKCRVEIFASHPYSWCVRCAERLPYRLNMERRPIMYRKCAVSPFDFHTNEFNDNRSPLR